MKKENSINTQTENEKKMRQLSHKMAVYFEERVTASSLARWVSDANNNLFLFSTDLKIESEKGEAIQFINLMGSCLLPKFIDCKSKAGKISFLEKELILLFDFDMCKVSKESLAEIGISFFKSFVRYTTYEKDVADFMNILTTFTYVLAIYSEYEWLAQQTYKEKQAAA